MHFGDELRRHMARQSFRLTPGLLARLSGVPKGTIVNWLEGRVSRPRERKSIVRVADALRLRGEERRQFLRCAGADAANEDEHLPVFDMAPVGLYRTTPDGRILAANETIIALLKYPDLPTYLRLNARDLYCDPTARGRWRERIDEAEELYGEITRARASDGSVVLVRDTARVVRGHDGNVLWYEGVWEPLQQTHVQ